MEDRMCGRIKWYKPKKEYGYITGYDEETYFFRNSDKNNIFEENDEVLFEPIEGENTLMAIRVEKN